MRSASSNTTSNTTNTLTPLQKIIGGACIALGLTIVFPWTDYSGEKMQFLSDATGIDWPFSSAPLLFLIEKPYKTIEWTYVAIQAAAIVLIAGAAIVLRPQGTKPPPLPRN